MHNRCRKFQDFRRLSYDPPSSCNWMCVEDPFPQIWSHIMLTLICYSGQLLYTKGKESIKTSERDNAPHKCSMLHEPSRKCYWAVNKGHIKLACFIHISFLIANFICITLYWSLLIHTFNCNPNHI